MLKVYFGDMTDAIYNPDIYFDNQYEKWWITTPWAKKVIKGIDKSVVISENIIDSPVLGAIPPVWLSGGTKTLLLIEYDDSHIFNASMCGDNCAKYLLDIGEQKDVVINLRHIMDFGEEEFEIEVLNSGKVVHNMLEFLDEGCDIV